jgi:hypothetical protein
MGGRNACFVSVADDRFERETERFEGLCPIVKASFALSPSSTEGGVSLTTG